MTDVRKTAKTNKQTNKKLAKYANDPREPWEIKRDMRLEQRGYRSSRTPAIG